MLGMYCQFRRDQHEIVHPSGLERWLKQEVPEDVKNTIFIYRHRESENFVIAEWVGSGIFREVLCIGRSLGNFNRKQAQQLIRMYRQSIHGGEMAKVLRQQERNRISAEQDRNDEKKELMERRKSPRIMVGYGS